MDTGDQSRVRLNRAGRLLAAAEGVFLRDGYRATTMEGLAQAAGISKATLYGYFPDKEAVFRAVCDGIATRLAEVVQTALQSGDATVRGRVQVALTAKHRLVHDLVRVSPHAVELFATKDATARDRFRQMDQQIEGWLTEALRPKSDDPLGLARLLIRASHGIANSAADMAETERDLARLCALIDVDHTP